MKALVISTLYPNRTQPVHAVFVEQRVQAMARRFPVVVLCPVPWFPVLGRLPRYAHRARIPRHEVRGGVPVHYPRFLSVPMLLKPLDGFFLFLSCLAAARRIRSAFPFDRIDAHLAYPDGWGALLLGRVLRLPVAVTLRGHDVNDLPRYPVRRRQVAATLRRAGVVLAVAESLRRAAIELGASPERTFTVPNGVDPERFRAHDRSEARRALGLDTSERIILCVGHLVARKGFQHVVRALPRVLAARPEARLVIVGAKGEEGDYSRQLQRTIAECGVGERVLMAGAVTNEDLALWYSSADVFCLASEKEGRANVLLEALACGTPVVATDVWGTPEIVADDSLGMLVERTDPETLAGALLAALEREWDRARLVRHASGFSWDVTAELVEKALAGLAAEGGT